MVLALSLAAQSDSRDKSPHKTGFITVNKVKQKAEVTLHVRGKELHCESEESDLYAAIDLLADKLDRQVLKYKDKLYEKRA